MTFKEELLDIWTSISTHETIEFINHQLKRVNIKSIPYATAQPIINRLLQHYSTGQLWSLAYRTMQKVCEVILINNIPEPNRPDIFLEIFIKKGIQHIDNGWNLKQFERWGFQCKQSEYSKYYFNQVIKIAEGGFKKRPCISNFSE